MKTYFINFTVQRSDGSIVLSQAFSTTSQSLDSASSMLEFDLVLLENLLSSDLSVVYDLTKIYCNGK